jgi:hypothetical protein
VLAMCGLAADVAGKVWLEAAEFHSFRDFLQFSLFFPRESL